MDLKKYDKLRKKIITKDFEGNNKGLDKWLYIFSFIGNISAMFFAYFLVYPSLYKAITLNFIEGMFGMIIAFIFTTLFLMIFEISKRYFIRNFSSDYYSNFKKFNRQVLGWLILSIIITVLSFYLSISGSNNLATTSLHKNIIVDTKSSTYSDSLSHVYDIDIKKLNSYRDTLRNINNNLLQKQLLSENPKETRLIEKNNKIIAGYEVEISNLKKEFESKIIQIKNDVHVIKSDNKIEDNSNILLFIIIVVFNELLIIGGIYFREYYEFKLYEINKNKFEKIYQKKDRYRILLTFIYKDGKMGVGDKVISVMMLKELIKDKSPNISSNKIVDEFFRDMDGFGIFTTIGKRRQIAKEYHDALHIIENYDDTLRILENFK